MGWSWGDEPKAEKWQQRVARKGERSEGVEAREGKNSGNIILIVDYW